jgi:hypothetical protein
VLVIVKVVDVVVDLVAKIVFDEVILDLGALVFVEVIVHDEVVVSLLDGVGEPVFVILLILDQLGDEVDVPVLV